MAQFDLSSKWLIQFHGDALLRLAGVEGIISWKAAHSELVLPGQLPDGLIEAQLEGAAEPDFFLVEVGTYPEQRLVDQLTRGTLLVLLTRRVLPEAIAFVLHPKGAYEVPEGISLVSPRGCTELGLRWRIVELWKISAEELLRTEDPGAMPWVPLCRPEGTPEETLRRCRDIIDSKARPEEVANLLAVTQVLARLRYNDPGLFTILGGRAIMIESPLIQELVAESGTKQRVETVQRDILRILALRFGAVPVGVAESVQQTVDEDGLSVLFEQAVCCDSLETFRARLD